MKESEKIIAKGLRQIPDAGLERIINYKDKILMSGDILGVMDGKTCG